MASIPKLERGQRLGPREQARIGSELRRRYDAGSSIRQLCEQTGYSIGRVRRLLVGAEVSFRARGGYHIPPRSPRSHKRLPQR